MIGKGDPGKDGSRGKEGGPVVLTALMFAAAKGYTPVVEILLINGSRVDARAADGSTAVMWAARNGHRETVAALIAGGADLTLRDEKGWTALDHAVLNGHDRVVACLRGESAGERDSPAS
jgi:uncharacterized protein